MNRNINFYRTTTLLISVVLLLVVVILILITYLFPQLSEIAFFEFAMRYHFELMIIAVLVAIAFGFIWARVLTAELANQSTQTQNLSDVVLKFLSHEERLVLTHLSQKGGVCRQQEFAYLNNMGRVKAMRTVQKLAQRGIIKVEPHGKQRTVTLLVDLGQRREKLDH